MPKKQQPPKPPVDEQKAFEDNVQNMKNEVSKMNEKKLKEYL